MRVLISGASVAGPTLAYWLHRYGFRPVVVERAPRPRLGSGGHAVDLFAPAVRIAERMGVADDVRRAATRLTTLTLERPGAAPVDVELSRLSPQLGPDQHVEIMRGELASILHDATRDDVEYLFGASIASLAEDDDGVDVTLDSGERRRVDIVVGADGLHSTVRRLAFGPESDYRHYLGGYLAAFSVPNDRGLAGRMVTHTRAGKLVGIYPVWQTGAARALFLFRSDEELAHDHRDVDRQRDLLRRVFGGDGWEVPRLLHEMDDADDFYLDSISQIRLDTWGRDRIALVGDAGYSPGPAVGGGTTVAMVGAYVLAGQLAEAGGDPAVAFPAYQEELRDYVHASRALGPRVMKSIVPGSAAQSWLSTRLLRLVPRLPTRLVHAMTARGTGAARTLSAFPLRDYRVPAEPA